MHDGRQEIDRQISDRRTVEKVAEDLGIAGRGQHFFCPGCQPLQTGTPEMVIKSGHFQCFRCGAAGDVVGLVKLARRCDLQAAIHWLEGETGMPPS
jgi:hypothetical protein